MTSLPRKLSGSLAMTEKSNEGYHNKWLKYNFWAHVFIVSHYLKHGGFYNN